MTNWVSKYHPLPVTDSIKSCTDLELYIKTSANLKPNSKIMIYIFTRKNK
jgi:hypothetical protein